MRRKILYITYYLLIGILPIVAQVKMPEMKFEKPVPGKTYYLYNIGYRAFFCGGNLYHTQASLSKFHGWKVRIKPYTENGQWDGLTIFLQDSIESGNNLDKFRNVFVESEGLVYTDQAELTSMRDNIWRLSEIDKESEIYYISLSEYNKVYSPDNTQNILLSCEQNASKEIPAVILCNKEQGIHTEWGFITEQEFQKVREQYLRYMNSQELYELIDSVHTIYPHINTDKAAEVCNDSCSSNEEILNEIGLMRTVLFSNGVPSDEVSFTSILLNPNFDQGSDKTWDMNFDNEAGAVYWQGGYKINPCADAFQTTFEFSQEIKGLPDGVYRMDVQAFYRTRTNYVAWFERDTAYVVTEIFANDFSRPVHNLMQLTMKDIDGEIDYLKIDGVLRHNDVTGLEHTFMNIDGTYVVDNLNAASLAFAHGYADQSIYFLVNDGTAKIGIRQDKKRGWCWSAWDNFRLYYLGNNTNSYTRALSHNVMIAKDIIRQTSLMGMNNSALSKVVRDAEMKKNVQDVEVMRLDIQNLQHEQNILRQRWKEKEFKKSVKIVGFENYNRDSINGEKATREKYIDLSIETFRLACQNVDSNPQNAIKLFKKAIQFALSDSLNSSENLQNIKFQSNYNLGYLYEHLNDYNNSVKHYMLSLAYATLMFHENPGAHRYALARTYYNIMVLYGKFENVELHDQYLEKALQQFEELYASDQENEEVNYWLSGCYCEIAIGYENKNDFVNALVYIDKAISMLPFYAEHYDSKGAILLMQGKNEEAFAMWEKVLELNPNFLMDDHPNGTDLSNGLKKLGLIE